MEELKKIYNNFFQEENKPARIAFGVFIFLLTLVIITGIGIFYRPKRYNQFNNNSSHRIPYRQYQPVNSYKTPERINTYTQSVPIKKVNSPPNKGQGYLIRKKPGYTEQSPSRKSYPARFKISSVLR